MTVLMPAPAYGVAMHGWQPHTMACPFDQAAFAEQQWLDVTRQMH